MLLLNLPLFACLTRAATSICGATLSLIGDFKINSKCEFSCNERYQLRGLPSVTCQLDRTMENGLGWSGPIPGCEPICPEVPKVENAVVACDSATDIGSICKYVCKRGFELVGRPTTTCLLDVTDSTANWEIGLPRCQRTCDKPIEIENGEVSCQDAGFVIDLLFFLDLSKEKISTRVTYIECLYSRIPGKDVI